jgi:hypothetical protein
MGILGASTGGVRLQHAPIVYVPDAITCDLEASGALWREEFPRSDIPT